MCTIFYTIDLRQREIRVALASFHTKLVPKLDSLYTGGEKQKYIKQWSLELRKRNKPVTFA